MAIIVKYASVKREGTIKKLPYISVDLKGKNGKFWVHTLALIDSGADISVIPQDFAELIGVEIGKDITIAKGIGGPVRVVNSTMDFQIKGGEDHKTYNFNIPVQVILDKTDAPPLLGRDGFFSYFRIEFDHYNEKVKLIKNSITDFRLKKNKT